MAARSLGRSAGPFFAYGLGFQSAPDARGASASTTRAELLRMLDAFRADPEVRAHPPQDVEEACFALVAWADETILRTPWSSHDEWAREPLQLQLYATNKAGDEFYEHLERLRPEQSAARHVYFLCLALGFEGQYAGHDAERQTLIGRQYEMLRMAGLAVGLDGREALVPPAYDLEIEVEPMRARRLWPALLAIALAGAGIYTLLWLLLRAFAGRVASPLVS